MKMDSVYSFKSTFATCWDKLCLFFKRISVSKQPKRIQDCEGVVWDVSINPFSCTRATGETAEAEASVFPSSSTMTYILQVPKLSYEDTLLAIQTYVEELMGQEVMNDSSIVFSEQKRSSLPERRVTAVLAQKKAIEEWKEGRSKGNRTPSLWFFPKQLCLQTFFETSCITDTPLFIVDLDFSEITLLCMQKGNLMACRSLPMPSHGEVVPAQAIKQIAASLLSWNNGSLESSPRLLLTGPLSQKKEWKDAIAESLPFSFHETGVPENSIYPDAALLGASLLSNLSLVGPIPPALLSSSKKPCQKAWRKTLITVSLVSFLVSLLFYCVDKRREDALKSNMEQEFVSLAQETWAAPFRELLATPIPSYLDAQESMERIMAEMKKQSLYPLQPALPSLSEVMEWLGALIHEVSPEEEAITIQKLIYSFVQYPTLAQPQKHYQLKIDLEFTSNNAQIARAFHDRLLSLDTSRIDHRNEIKWNMSQGTYKTTFFIKDKTNYNSLM